MNYLTTADRPSTAVRSRTAAGTGQGCCNNAAPGAAHSRGDVNAAAAEASTTVQTLQRSPAAADPASVTRIPTGCFAPQSDWRLDVAPSETANGLGSFGIVAAAAPVFVVVVAVIAAGQVIARKYCGK